MKIKIIVLSLMLLLVVAPLASHASTQAERDKATVAAYKAKFKADRAAHKSKQKLAADKARLREAKIKAKEDRAAGK